MDILTDQGIRLDGRRPNELRKIICKLGVSPGTDGSAYIEHGHSKVLVSVYGPHDVSSDASKIFFSLVILPEFFLEYVFTWL